MKKYALYFIAIAFITIAGCSKGSSSSGNKMTYIVTGLSDVTIRQYIDTSFTIAVGVGYEGGTQEAVTLSLSGLPSGVTVTPTTASGTPSYAATFTFHANATASGTFPITVNATTVSSGTKTFSFNLIVSPGVLFAYSFTGLSDITIPQYVDTTITIPISLSYTQGTSEIVTIAPATPPAGITVSTAPTSGTPTFSSTVSLHVAENTAGTYAVTLNTSSASTGTQPHSFNVTVSPSSNCAPEIGSAIAYTTNTTCASYSSAGITGPGTGMIYSNGVTNEVYMEIPFTTLTATLNCSNGTFTTQPKSTADFSIPAGSGTFTPNTIVVNYTLTGVINSTCTTTYTR